MSIHYKFKNMESSASLKSYVDKKVAKFEKYITYPVETHVIFAISRGIQSVEITLHAEHHEMVATAKTEDMYESIDAVVVKIESQLKKEREKKKGHAAAHKISRRGEKLGSDVAAELPHQGKARRAR